jgi:hypothetical protein
MQFCFKSTLLLVLVALPLGCSANSYKTAPVSGRVTLDGHPVAGAEIRFFPLAGNSNLPTSAAVTDDQGNYELRLQGDGNLGAVVGENHVTISENQQNKDFMRQQMAMQKAGHIARPREILPAKYNRESKLTCTVPPEGMTDANFDLKSK